LSATMKDIAAHLGISPSTVSRAINNTGYVSEDLRAKIYRTVTDLDYQPNLLARGLRKKSTNLVGLIVPDLMNAYYTGMAQAIEGLLAAREYRLILSVSNDDPASELSYLQAMQKQRVAGIIIASTSKNVEYLSYLLKQGIPVTAFMREVRCRAVDNILARDVEGAYQAMRHLLDLGHHRIGIVCGSQDVSSGRDRLKGCMQALLEAGISIDNQLIRIGAFRRAFGTQAAHELLDMRPRPTAIFSAGGELTAGTVKALFDRQIKIPDEISLVGYDDPEWFSFWQPPVTTVFVPIDKLSESTVELVCKRMAAQKVPRRGATVRVPLKFVIRSSTVGLNSSRQESIRRIEE
jgi:LacI family transcriptional regulator